jgi:glucokinase
MKAGLAPRLHQLVEGDAGRVSPREMADAAQAGDEAVADAIRRAAEFLGIGAANVMTILHPELIVFGGGVAQMGDVLLQHVRDTVRRRVRMIPTEDLRIERSLLGERAGVLGGVALASRGISAEE